MKYFLALALFLTLTGCIIPFADSLPNTSTTQCAFVEAYQAQPELSAHLIEKLKQAALPVETARAEAYGENCIAADNSVVRFAQREIDFHITLNVTNLADESTLGSLLEKALTVIDQLPPDQLGPNPGYIGITFQAGNQTQHLWFTQAKADDLRAQGLKGLALYQALNGSP